MQAEIRVRRGASEHMLNSMDTIVFEWEVVFKCWKTSKHDLERA